MAVDELVADLPTDPAVAGHPGADDAVSSRAWDDLSALSCAKFAVVRLFLWGWVRLFSLRGLYLFGVVFGTGEWLVDYRRRRRVRQRVREVFAPDDPPPHARHAVWRHFVRARCDKLLYMIFDKLPRERILERVRFDGREHLDAALERGHGAVIALNHSGPHHVALLLMALLGYPVIAVRDRKEGALRRYMLGKLADSFREFRTVRWFFADDYPRDLYRWLGEGGVLSGALDVSRDRGTRASTSTVRIFGREQEFVNGPVKLAVRCQAPILQGFIVSGRDYYYRLVVTEPLLDHDRTDGEGTPDIDSTMQRYADQVEAHVRRYPCQLSRI